MGKNTEYPLVCIVDVIKVLQHWRSKFRGLEMGSPNWIRKYFSFTLKVIFFKRKLDISEKGWKSCDCYKGKPISYLFSVQWSSACLLL